MTIINLTQHMATAEQVAQGVVEPADKAVVKNSLTFTRPPTPAEIDERADCLAGLAEGHHAAMIGGAGYLMPALERALRARGIVPLHSFTQRVTREEPRPDGTVEKVSVFAHVGWVTTA